MNSLYVIKEDRLKKTKIGQHAYKIGFSKNVPVRIDTLQIGNTQDLILIKEFKCLDSNALEKIVHKKYKEYRFRGEWFYFTDNELESCIEIIDNLVIEVNDYIAKRNIQTPLVKKNKNRKHHCIVCKYWTENKSNYNKHLKSEKHLHKSLSKTKKSVIDDREQRNFAKTFQYDSTMSNHENCVDMNIPVENKILRQKNELLEKQVCEQNKILENKQILEEINKLRTEVTILKTKVDCYETKNNPVTNINEIYNISTINYTQNNYPNAEP